VEQNSEDSIPYHTHLRLRQSTPICVLMSESCEPPMNLRFEMLTSRYIYKCLSRRFSIVIRSLRRLEVAPSLSSSHKRVQLIKNILTFKACLTKTCTGFDTSFGCPPPLFTVIALMRPFLSRTLTLLII